MNNTRSITFVVNNHFLISASGINTFLLHLKEFSKRNNIELQVYSTTPNCPNFLSREVLSRKHDVVITNDLESAARCKRIKCHKKIDYLHIGDVHAFGYDEFKYNDMGASYVFEYTNILKDLTVSVSQSTQVKDLTQRGIKSNLHPMPFYPTAITPPVKQEGIISVMPDCPRKNLDFCLQCPSDIPFTFVGCTTRTLPLHFTSALVDNSSISALIAQPKVLLLPSYIDTYGYVLLEAMQYTRPVLLNQRWNAELPFDRVQTFSEVQALMNAPYTPPFDVWEYSANTEKEWLQLFQ